MEETPPPDLLSRSFLPRVHASLKPNKKRRLRIPWSLSRVRQEKHAKGIIHWMTLLYGQDIVRKNLLDGMYRKLESTGQLDTEVQEAIASGMDKYRGTLNALADK